MAIIILKLTRFLPISLSPTPSSVSLIHHQYHPFELTPESKQPPAQQTLALRFQSRSLSIALSLHNSLNRGFEGHLLKTNVHRMAKKQSVDYLFSSRDTPPKLNYFT
ncbi:hypothetical protein LguiA_005111 [Lonicera macranthoides]